MMMTIMKCAVDQITVEKTPNYFLLDQLVSRVYQMNSSIRLLVTFRDPVERLVSGYVQVPLQVV